MENQKALFEEIPKFDSKEELLFHYYLEELKSIGLIKYVKYQPKKFQLLDGLNEKIRVDRNGKTYIHDVVLLKPKHYTADWKN